MTCGVYKITNTCNGKFYIGSAEDLCKRFRNHQSALTANCHKNAHLQSSWNKHGKQAFEFSVLEYCEKDQKIEREQFYMDLLKPEYNIASVAGSPLGVKRTEDTKRRMSEAHIGKSSAMLGKFHTDETKRKMSASSKGRIFTDEHKHNISVARTGRKHTDETKRKMSEGLRRHWETIR